METPLQILTYSSGTTLCHCECKYFWRYIRCIRPRRDDSEPLWIGSAMHAGLEALAHGGLEAGLAKVDEFAAKPAIGEAMTVQIEERACKARAMVRAASERWPNVIGPTTERLVEMPVINPETGRQSRSFEFRGKLDGLVADTLHDWKSTSDPQQTIREKVIGYQAELYALALSRENIPVAAADYRLVKTPSLQFQRDGAYTKKYGGNQLDYERACYEWLVSEPGHLVEHNMHLNQGRIMQAQTWLWRVGKRILENLRTGFWLTNELACHKWSRVCEYMPLCEARACGDDAEWIIDQQFEIREPHPELSETPSPPA